MHKDAEYKIVGIFLYIYTASASHLCIIVIEEQIEDNGGFCFYIQYMYSCICTDTKQ